MREAFDAAADALKGTRFESLGLDVFRYGDAATASFYGQGAKSLQRLKDSAPHVSAADVEAAVQKGAQAIDELVKSYGTLAKVAGWVGKAVPYLNAASAAISTATAVELNKDPEAWRIERGLADLSATLNIAAAAASAVPGLGWAAGGAVGLTSMGVDVALAGTVLLHKYSDPVSRAAQTAGGAFMTGAEATLDSIDSGVSTVTSFLFSAPKK